MTQWIKKHWLECVLSVVMTILAAVIITWKFTYLCDTNDDVLLRSIASGAFTGEPDAHLIYIMYPLGVIFKTLYNVAGDIAWYDVFMIGTHYIAWCLIIYRVGSLYLKKSHKIIASVVSMLVLILIDLPYVIMHQYTVLAAVVGVVALLWILTDCSENGRQFIFSNVVTVVSLLFCLWIRKQVFIMLVPFLAVAVFLCIWKRQKEERKNSIRRYLWLSGIVLFFTTGSLVIEKVAYSDDTWQQFQAYNEARTDIYDFYQAPPYEIYEETYSALGFNEYDYTLIQTNNIGLVSDVDTEVLETLASESKDFKEWQEQYYSVYRKTLFSLFDYFLYNDVQPIGAVLLMLYAGILVWTVKENRKAEGLAVIAIGLFQSFFVAYFLYQNRFPERVSYGFFLMQFVFLTGLLLSTCRPSKKSGEKKEYFWKILITISVIFIVANFGMYRYKTTLDRNTERVAVATEWETIKNYCSQHSQQQFFLKTNAIGAYCEKMFDGSRLEPSNTHYLGTWLLNSPLYASRLENAGIESPEQYFASSAGRMLQLGGENTEWITMFYRERGYAGTVDITDCIMLPDGSTMSVLEMIK